MTKTHTLPDINSETPDEEICDYLQQVAERADQFRRSQSGCSWAVDLILEARRRGIEIPEEKKS